MNGVLNLEELRIRGFSEDLFADEELLELESRVWETIKLFTNRDFELKTITLKLDGSGDNTLYLPIEVQSILSVDETNLGTLIEGQDYVVYNRVVPDDREGSKLVLLRGKFPQGNQNVAIQGIFGYIDPESPEEFPPKPLIEVAMRLLSIFAEPLLEEAEREFDVAMHKRNIRRESTDRFSYTLFDRQPLEQSLLDDPFINSILLKYRKGSDIIFGDWI